MATLAPGGRISREIVAEEIQRLRGAWCAGDEGQDLDILTMLGPDRLAEIDLFDRAQLATVIRVCRQSVSLSDAGRKLFEASRARRSTVNDSDRVRKYLAKFELSWEEIR